MIIDLFLKLICIFVFYIIKEKQQMYGVFY